jgi:formylglycine-generating enzyme required for sulfatase activity
MKKVLALAAVALAGCGIIAGIDPLNVDPCYDGCDGGDGGDATIDAPIDGPPTDGGSDVIVTDSGCPAKMIPVPASPKYCIDSTEVTFADYGKFVAAKGSDTSGQIALCTGNTSYAPGIIGSGSIPVRNVDWCDAVAYCLWAGKRLCGKIGGGSVPQNDFENPAINQWLYACSAGGTQPFPYGSTYQDAACNTDLDANTPMNVGTEAKCVGGFPGIFDMIGNVWEFVDAPDTVQNTVLIYGAAYTTWDTTFNCSTGFAFPFAASADDVGFRCCSP